MTTIGDLFAPELLAEMIRGGYVKAQQHPVAPLSIYNYSDACTYERVWNDVTRQCRGLIVHDDGTVVARPFPKFFNHGEPAADGLDTGGPVLVTDKLDGSLGILYWVDDLPSIATRGSFTSEQAEWATDWFRRYAHYDVFDRSLTYLFEILVKWNRIVVAYDWEGLVLLDVIDTTTGRSQSLQIDPWLLQARTARNDAGEHQAQERLAHVPGVPESGSTTGTRQDAGPSSGVREAVARAESGTLTGDSAARVRNTPAGDGSQEGASLPGLRGDVSAGVHGLRSRTRGEAAGPVAGTEPAAVSRGDHEVRTHLCELPPAQNTPTEAFRVATRFDCASLADALAMKPRPNAEGLVVHFPDTDQRVKIKQEDYVRLHRIISGLNARVVWEHLAAGRDIADLIEPLPDEFHAWALDVADDLAARVKTTAADVEAVYSGTVAGLAPGWGRKEYALAVKDHPLKSALFMRLDGRDYMPLLWRQAEPRGDVRPSNAPTA